MDNWLIGYARVSTEEQNIDLQMDALKKAGCSKIFVDKDSGSNRRRPELKRALDTLRPNDTLVVWKTDRLSRSVHHLCIVSEELKQKGIHFKSLTEPIDTASPAGQAFFHMIGVFAEFERSTTLARIHAGIAAARKRGVHLGRPVKCTQAIRDRAEHMILASNLTQGEIAESLGIHRITLYKLMKEMDLDDTFSKGFPRGRRKRSKKNFGPLPRNRD